MAINKIYRGGVHRTTPETREVKLGGSTKFKPGAVVELDATNGVKVATAGEFFYVVGETLHGSVTDEYAIGDTMRLYSPRSGDLLAAQASAGITLSDDLALTIDTAGTLKAATVGTDTVFAYVDWPASEHPAVPSAATIAGQLIPIKIK
mgnify:CR=1 FL=1